MKSGCQKERWMNCKTIKTVCKTMDETICGIISALIDILWHDTPNVRGEKICVKHKTTLLPCVCSALYLR